MEKNDRAHTACTKPKLANATLRDEHPLQLPSSTAPPFPPYLDILRLVARPEAEKVNRVHSVAFARQHGNVLAEVPDRGAEAVYQQDRRPILRPFWLPCKQTYTNTGGFSRRAVR